MSGICLPASVLTLALLTSPVPMVEANGICGCGWACVDFESCVLVGTSGQCAEYECQMTGPCEGLTAHGVECGCLFCDGFESGDLTRWSGVQP